MGRKQPGRWKYFYLFIAGLIAALCFGCAAVMNLEKKLEARDHINHGERLLEQRNFKLSLQEHKKAESLLGNLTPGDRVLYNMGTIYAHLGNHKANYGKSIKYFRRLVKEFPQSPMIWQAKIWIEVLAAAEKKKPPRIKTKTKAKKKITPKHVQEYGHLSLGKKLLDSGDFKGSLVENQKVLSRFPNAPPGDSALFNMALVYAHYRNPARDYNKSIVCFKRLITEFPQSTLLEQAKIWVEVLETMEKAKQVDIEIERKRKELTT